MMMAMCRLNVPSIFIYGGSILPGSYRGLSCHRAGSVRGCRGVPVGKMSADDLDELEQGGMPSCRACGAQFTANTMATASEAIGLALPIGGAPAPYEIRDRFCMAAGEKVMDLIALNIRPRDIVTGARRWRTPRQWWQRPAALRTPRCICRPSRMNAVSTLTSSWSPKVLKRSNALHRRPEAVRLRAMSPRTCSRLAAFRS